MNPQALHVVIREMKEVLAQIEAKKADLQKKESEVRNAIKVAERALPPDGEKDARRPKGLNLKEALALFAANPEQEIGPAELAERLKIAVSSAAATFENNRDHFEKNEMTGRWRLKPVSPGA